MAVILLVVGLVNIFSGSEGEQQVDDQKQQKIEDEYKVRHPLSGVVLQDKEFACLPISIMVENSVDVLPQEGLSQADVIYESLAEGNITRLLAVYDSTKSVDKIGPVRSARPYFIDWASEYGGIYMHVGGSPEALDSVDDYDLINVDQIGVGEVYFWRDQNLLAPHNVFTSNSNWLRAAEIRGGDEYYCRVGGIGMWNFVDIPQNLPEENENRPEEILVDFSTDLYQVDWKFNQNLKSYQRWQGGDKYIYDTGDQVAAQNVIVQVSDIKVVDEIGRRDIDTQSGGVVYVFNFYGLTKGEWRVDDGGRTRFYDDYGDEIELVPGKTWVEIVPSEENISYK